MSSTWEGKGQRELEGQADRGNNLVYQLEEEALTWVGAGSQLFPVIFQRPTPQMKMLKATISLANINPNKIQS